MIKQTGTEIEMTEMGSNNTQSNLANSVKERSGISSIPSRIYSMFFKEPVPPTLLSEASKQELSKICPKAARTIQSEEKYSSFKESRARLLEARSKPNLDWSRYLLQKLENNQLEIAEVILKEIIDDPQVLNYVEERETDPTYGCLSKLIIGTLLDYAICEKFPKESIDLLVKYGASTFAYGLNDSSIDKQDLNLIQIRLSKYRLKELSVDQSNPRNINNKGIRHLLYSALEERKQENVIKEEKQSEETVRYTI